MVKTKKPSEFDGCWVQFYIEFYTFSRKSVKQENKFKLLLCSTTGFNDKVQIQLLTLPFCFSSHNIIWEKLDTFDKTKQPCPSGPYGRPLVNTAIWYFSEQEEGKENTHYCIFTIVTETAIPQSVSVHI